MSRIKLPKKKKTKRQKHFKRSLHCLKYIKVVYHIAI